LAVDVCAAVCYRCGGLPALNVVVDCLGYAVAIGFADEFTECIITVCNSSWC